MIRKSIYGDVIEYEGCVHPKLLADVEIYPGTEHENELCCTIYESVVFRKDLYVRVWEYTNGMLDIEEYDKHNQGDYRVAQTNTRRSYTKSYTGLLLVYNRYKEYLPQKVRQQFELFIAALEL